MRELTCIPVTFYLAGFHQSFLPVEIIWIPILWFRHIGLPTQPCVICTVDKQLSLASSELLIDVEEFRAKDRTVGQATGERLGRTLSRVLFGFHLTTPRSHGEEREGSRACNTDRGQVQIPTRTLISCVALSKWCYLRGRCDTWLSTVPSSSWSLLVTILSIKISWETFKL